MAISHYAMGGRAPTLKPHPEMVKNDAGGYVFPIDKWAYLDRILFCGTADGTYYTNAKKLTENAFDGVIELLHARKINP